MDQPNIILIVLDAVRADHTLSHQDNRSTTPNLDALANDAAVFENAFANSNWTGTSHGTIFTGRLPSDTGIYGDNQKLPLDYPTLPEVLKKAGYRTFGMSAGAHIRAERGYNRGMDKFKETYRISPSQNFFSGLLSDTSFRKQVKFSLLNGPDKKTLFKFDSLKNWIQAGDKPFFGFINTKTAHHPYNPPRPHKSKFCTQLKRPRYQFIEEVLGGDKGDYQSVPGMNWQHLKSLSYEYPVIGNRFEPTNEEWEVIKSWYDGAIHYMDQRIGELVDWLRERNQFKDTYLIVTADHGEYFGEHGLEKHYYGLYEPVLHVPLLIHSPNTGSESIADPVTLADIYPTIVDVGTDTIPDLPNSLSLNNSDEISSREYVFAELGAVSPNGIISHNPDFGGEGYGIPTQVVRDDKYKLIKRNDGSLELYNWKEDPSESNDISDHKPDVTEKLADIIDYELSRLSEEELSENIDDPDLQQHLEDLGYM